MTTQQDQATAIQTTYQANVAKIRANASLSGNGKRIELAKEYTTAKTASDALLEDQGATSATRNATLERQLFGLPINAPTADTVSYRDALDRVSNIDWTSPDASGELARMYANAKLSNDTILGKAILSQAFAFRNVDLINQYAEDNPSQAAAIDELWTAQNANRSNLLGNMAFYTMKPTELGALDDVSIAALARQSTTTDTTASTASPGFTTASY
jgi:hypothetical protein